MESSEEGGREGRSLEETPTWAVATVISMLVTVGFLIHGSLKKFGHWLNKRERKPLMSALEKVKDELMIFGLLSLLLGHWAYYIAQICVESSELSSNFYPCAPGRAIAPRTIFPTKHFVSLKIDYSNVSSSSKLSIDNEEHQDHNCPKGRKPLASYHSLEQLHRFLFVLGSTHVLYSFMAVALAVFRMYNWRSWEKYAMSMAIEGSLNSQVIDEKMQHLSSFVTRHTSHPWSHHTVLVWLFCFARQFWSSIDQTDYVSLRQGFITTHQLPLAYNFHKYMFRSMEEEFQYIVGISIPLWIFTILCVLLGFHGTNVYFWMSFFPPILVLLIGTKLHLVIVKLAVEITETNQQVESYKYNPKDDYFWFGNPRLLLQLIHFLTFQNAFEMAMYLWSLWEIRGPSCLTQNHTKLIIRLTFGIVTQFWCSFITFPLYVIVAQMGSRYKRHIISESVRKSIHEWRSKASSRIGESKRSLMSLEALLDADNNTLNPLSLDRYKSGLHSASINSLSGFQIYQGLPDTFRDHSLEECGPNEGCPVQFSPSVALDHGGISGSYNTAGYGNQSTTAEVKDSSSFHLK